MPPRDERLSTSIQESLATAIAFGTDNNCAAIAKLLNPEHFDEPFDAVVTRCLDYRNTYKKPPGKSHIDDVFSDILEDKDHKQNATYNRVIRQMMHQADGLNTQYLLAETTGHILSRHAKGSIIESVERFQKGGPAGTLITDLNDIWRKALKIQDTSGRNYGFTLAEEAALGFLDRSANDFCLLGIPQLDEYEICPAKGELFLFLAARNRGKSLFLVHCGKYALLKGWKVVHYTLENSDVQTSQRYYQSIFSGVKREGSYHFTQFDNKDTKKIKLRKETIVPYFVIENRAKTSDFLTKKIKEWEDRLNNIRIRRFPSGRLSFSDLERDLDEMALVHNFMPDMIMIDMPQLMRADRRKESYEALGLLTTDLRGLAVERNVAMVVPQQGTRGAESAKTVDSRHGAGSIEMFNIADNALTYSQTDSEETHGLARLYAGKVRNDRARFTLLISQHYASGQFYMDSWYMDNQLREEVKTYTGADPPENEDDEEPPKRAAK